MNEVQEFIRWIDENLFHFSAKTVHSSAPAAGIRIGREQALNLPYVSVRTLLYEGRPIGLDYLGNSAAHAGPFSRLRTQLGERGDEGFDAGIKNAYDATAETHREYGTSHVGPRLRQLLLPRGDGDYVAVTPLGSAGLCEEVRQVADLRRQSRKEEQAFAETQRTIGMDRAVNSLLIGGSNPQNAGGRIRQMSRPLVFCRVPESEHGTRMAFSLYFRGFRPTLPREQVRAYREWFESLEVENGQRVLTHWRRMEEERHVRWLLDAVERQAQRAALLMDKHRHKLPGEGMADQADLLSRGWLKPSLRNHEWKSETAVWFVERLATYPVSFNDGILVYIPFTGEDRRRLIRLVEEL